MSRANLADFEEIMRLLDARILWLRERGSDQWNTGRSFSTRVKNSIEKGETWLLRGDSVAVATLSLSQEGDPDFWSPAELRQKSLYLGKMATDPKMNGRGIGNLAIQWARDFAAKSGFDYVRWDVWRTNRLLQKYYRSVGAKYVRTEDVADRWSGALFEISAEVIPELNDRITTIGD